MYQPSYEEYMRSVLGYSMENPSYMGNTYENYTYSNTESNTPPCNCRLEESYPEIYRIVNPMVCKICKENARAITKESIEEMTDVIYRTVEPNIDAENRSSEIKESELKNGDVRKQNTKKEEGKVEDREERRNNYLLRDLIKILIINQLTIENNPSFAASAPRPPFLGKPSMPPFLGRIGPRMAPRDYNDMLMF